MALAHKGVVPDSLGSILINILTNFFEEVRETGFKIVLKNNSPACVLLTPEAYEQMLETIENYRLLVDAEKRMENAKAEDFIPAKKAMQELGISEADLKDLDVELE